MSSAKSWHGCWTCRVRHKKCDETYPKCRTCSSLLITCHYGKDKPSWMDNGPHQQSMVDQLKREVKEKAATRRTLGYLREAEAAPNEAQIQSWGNRHPDPGAVDQYTIPHRGPSSMAMNSTKQQTNAASSESITSVVISTQQSRSGPQMEVPGQRVWPGCDPGFVSYYLDFFFPFLFPFYQPHMFEGGRTWLLEFMNEAEGMQQVVLALSSYLFSIVLDATEAGHEICKKIGWEKLLAEMKNTFTRLRDVIPKLSQGYIDKNSQLSQAVRILGTIVHLQRFEIATLGFANCNTHLNAAVQCLRQILDDGIVPAEADVDSQFFAAMARLGPSPWPRPYRQFQVASPEQVAFRFFTSLLVVDDIVASTSLGEEPRLYPYHAGLLSGGVQHELPVDLEAVMGCQNWVMLQIGEISALAAWKRHHLYHDGLALEVISRGDAIRKVLENQLKPMKVAQNDTLRADFSEVENEVLGLFHVWQSQPSTPASQSKIITQIWAHAALIYLHVTVHGSDPMRPEIRQQVAHVIDLLDHKLSTPTLLRTIVWPFCVTGCLALPEKESFFRRKMDLLRPTGLFATMRKAVEIMESTWLRRRADSFEMVKTDMAACFEATGEILFLI